ncbi:MAG: hypothetical protein LC799_19205, partial [Actinobacteria bacterium]|nr:hypothetical protein [Actinomycetota bacterium]
ADVVRIREELERTVAMWRRLLFQHTPDSDDGRCCPLCRCGWRRRRWPCPVWAQAHARLVASMPPPSRAGVTSDLHTDQQGRHRGQ